MAPKIILTGFMASGKSAVGRALAKRLGWRLIDCDARIAAQAGKPIPEIFRESGEAGFRMLEQQIIGDLAADRRRCPQCGEPRPAVIATGGGAIVDLRNFEMLGSVGVIVCLTARPEIIARRIGASAKSRPMLMEGGKPLKERIAELIEARREAYARAAITVDNSELVIEQTVEVILKALAEYRQRQCRASA